MNDKILFATSNPNKIKEVRAIFKDRYIIEGLDSISFHQEIPETSDTIEGNARQKVEYISKFIDTAVIAEDTGLLVDALDGAPGVFSARFAGPEKSDEGNVRKLLSDLQGLENREAHFLTVVAYRDIFGGIVTFSGEIHGTIGFTPKGSHGFGYDPVFIPNGFHQTFGELSEEIKNRISHRKLAFEKLAGFLLTLP